MPSGAVELNEVRLLPRTELGLLAPQPALGPGDGHALPSPGTGKVSFKLGDDTESGKQQPADWVCRIVHRAADVQLDAVGGEFVNDVAGVRNRPGEPVELCHNERVAAAAGGERLAQSGPVAIGTGQAVVDIDPLRVDPSAVSASRCAVRS